MYGYKYVKTPDPIYIDNDDDAKKWCDYFLQCGAVGFDTETTGLHKLKTRVLFFGFSDGNTRICAPVRLLEHFRPVLEHLDIEKRLTNPKYDMHIVCNHNILLRGPVVDTIAADWLMDENRRGMHGLKETAKEYLGLRMRTFKEVFGGAMTVEAEVRMLGRIHDVIEADDEEAALDVLVELSRADCDDPEVLAAMAKLSQSRHRGYTLTAEQVLKMARDHGLANKTGGVKGFVSDFLELLGNPPLANKAEREQWAHLLEDHDLVAEAHEAVRTALRPRLKLDRDPLDMLILMTADYASLDPWGSYMLMDYMRDQLSGEVIDMVTDRTLLDYYEDTAVPFTRVLWNMERRGFRIDEQLAETYAKPLKIEAELKARAIVALLGHDLNPKSTKQLVDAFFTKDDSDPNHVIWTDPFGNKPKKISDKTGVPSVDSDALDEWAGRGNQLAKLLLEFREMEKVHNTYVEPLPLLVDHHGRIHTSLNQTGAVTGRLSSSDPNLQNIPSKGEWGPKIRDMFVAGLWGDCWPEWCMPEIEHVPVPDLERDFPMTLIVSDYDQLEMRIMAHFSEDETMLDAIHTGKDLHCLTVHLANPHIPYLEIWQAKEDNENRKTLTPRQKELLAMRSNYKAIGFGLIYGIGALKLGMNLGLKVIEQRGQRGRPPRLRCPEAEELITKYFGIFPGVKKFIDTTHDYCEQTQRVQTITGRFRRLPSILSEEGGIAAQAERQSVNSIIQGTAADIAILAMLKCERDPVLRELGCRMLLQVHDELVFEVPDDPLFIEPAMARINELMRDPFPMSVPITVSAHAAKSWGKAK